jgi:ATP-binding cassette subfamily B protein
MSYDTPADDEDDTFDEQRARVDRPMRRLFGTYGREHWLALTFGLAASVGAHSLALVPPFVLGVAVDAFFAQNPQPFALPLIPESLIPATKAGQFWFSGGVIALAFAGSAASTWLKGWGLNEFAQSIQHEIRVDTYGAMQRLDLAFFADKQTGELMSILNNDVNRLEQFLNGGLFVASMIGTTVVGVVAVLVYLNAQLAVVTLVTVPVVGTFTHVFVQRIQPMYAEVRSTVGRLNARLENNLAGIEVIKASNAESHEFDRVQETSGEYYEKNWEAISTRITFFPGLRLTAGIGFVVTYVVGGLWVFSGPPLFLTGTLSPGDFVAFVFLSQRFVWPLAQFGELVNMYQEAVASAERVFGLMDEPSTLGTGPGSTEDDAPALRVEAGRVEYDGVTFGYDADDTTVADVSFAIDGGDTLALVGPTGAGKSTLLKLLLRLYDADEGAVKIDGQDVRDVDPGSLRRHIGYVGQETFLFAGTVAENVRYGAFDAAHEEVVKAARAAQAHGFIADLTEGYDTEVGERGVKLSGGQRQRIGIARAVLQDPAIVVLDEATSDVDTETELRIQESLDALLEDRTVLAIAHRLSTVKGADRIVVLEEGRVIERGDHDALLARNGLYADLWGVQAGEIDVLPDGGST